MPATATATATCTRCDGSGQYHGTRRDGSAYVGSCFACQGGTPRAMYWSYRPRAVAPAVVPAPLPQGIAPNVALGLARGAAALVAFAAVRPAEYGWLVSSQAAGVAFAMSLLAGIKRYGNLTPRQLAAVQRNIPATSFTPEDAGERAEAAAAAIDRTPEGPPVTEAQVMAGTPVLLSSLVTVRPPTPAPTPAAAVMIEADNLRRALDAAAASGLRKVRLDLGAVTFKRTGPTFRAGGEGHILCYRFGSYQGRISPDNVFHARQGVFVETAAIVAFRLAASDPEAAARAHGADTTRCSCCRRTLTDPVSVMQGIGPVCIERFGWRLR